MVLTHLQRTHIPFWLRGVQSSCSGRFTRPCLRFLLADLQIGLRESLGGITDALAAIPGCTASSSPHPQNRGALHMQERNAPIPAPTTLSRAFKRGRFFPSISDQSEKP